MAAPSGKNPPGTTTGPLLAVAHAFDIEGLLVPAGAEHRFSAYERLCVLVIVERTPARGS